MKSPFDFKNSSNNNVRRTNFDWSHANNLTTAIGRITPFFVDLCPANSSLKIDPTLGLQFFPMVFPNQTRMYARASFFKVPLRALWEDYMDFVGNFRDGLVEPYHDFAGQIPSTGSLYDYLGLPTTFAGAFGSGRTYSFPAFDTIETYNVSRYIDMAHAPMGADFFGRITEHWESPDDVLEFLNDMKVSSVPLGSKTRINFDQSVYDANLFIYQFLSAKFDFSAFQYSDDPSASNVIAFDIDMSFLPYPSAMTGVMFFFDVNGKFIEHKIINFSHTSEEVIIQSAKYYVDKEKGIPYSGIFMACPQAEDLTSSAMTQCCMTNSIPFRVRATYTIAQTSTYGQVREIFNDVNPYYDSTSANKEKQIKISAYAARAYESIYNAFFRDNRNNPYYIDGQIEYNKWIPSRAGGADSYSYVLHYCNWEKDVFTTAVQSPQQGVAPLVGITTYTDMVTNDDGSTTVLNRVALVDEDGRKFGVDFQSDSEGLQAVNYTELDENKPVAKPRSLIDLVNSGISINDLRNVNAYQKFLELNMRQGYSYRDIIQGRFNVKVRYDELMMPEYCGGFSEEIKMSAVTQTIQRDLTSGKYADQLGAMAGNAGVRRSGKSVSIFCDEESIVMGVLYVVPVPIYSQVLPKHFLYRGLLDHFQPEFANIGFQPITYRELCPIQAFADNPDSLTETFGYNRPWYELVQKYDTAHGLYRTSLRNFIMNRTFESKPELSKQFLIVDPEQVNDVFAVTDVSDKIFGQIYLSITAKMPVGRQAIPRLD